MNAIVVTDEQATALRAANAGSILTLEPRRLQDGRLVLNADILDDPFFSDPAKPWAQILARQEVIVEEPAQGDAIPAIDAGVAEAVATSLEEVRSQIVTLTEAELAEPQ